MTKFLAVYKLKKVRLIARLDVKGPNLIKGVQLEGLRVLGSPQKFAEKYYSEGIDEILYMDLVASLYGRSKLTEIVSAAAGKIFVPLTVGGGVRTLDDIDDLLRAGADKVSINTAAVRNLQLISDAANRFGSQCIVASIEAKNQNNNFWEVYTETGRERTGIDVVAWAKELSELGAGEILLTSIDREGTGSGFDERLISEVSAAVKLPIIVSGGFGKRADIISAVEAGADAISIADALHYEKISLSEIREYCNSNNILVRQGLK